MHVFSGLLWRWRLSNWSLLILCQSLHRIHYAPLSLSLSHCLHPSLACHILPSSAPTLQSVAGVDPHTQPFTRWPRTPPQSYIGNYSSHTKVDRLEFIANKSAGTQMELDALRLAADELKKVRQALLPNASISQRVHRSQCFSTLFRGFPRHPFWEAKDRRWDFLAVRPGQPRLILPCAEPCTGSPP